MAATQRTAEEKERAKAASAKYREAHREEVRERDRAAKKTWREIHADINRARTAAWRKAHPEQNRERHQKWREENPGWTQQYNARYRADNAEAIKQQRAGRKEETRIAKKNWYEANQEAQRAYALQYSRAHPEQHAENYRRFVAIPANRMRMLVSDAGTRAKKRGLEFDGLGEIAASFPTDCPCCQATLDYTKTVFNLSPSLDRRDNSRGYTLDNVRVICRRCNSLKRDASIQDLENILAYMRRG